MFSKLINKTFVSCRTNREKKDFMTAISIDVLVCVFSYLTSHQVAAVRPVNRKFNKAGCKVLNRRFSFYCSFIPKTLRNALKNRSVFPVGSLKEGDLHVLSAALLLLRSIFGRYIVTGRCCFYPGLILDHIESITLSVTTKRCKWKLIDALRMRGRHLYYRSVNNLFQLIEMAADHFERHIEPLLPPPTTFIGTKVLDLFASTSDLQCEENFATFHQKVAENFPKSYPCNITIHSWMARLRSDVIKRNIQWILKTSRLLHREIVSTRQKLRWYSSQTDFYKADLRLSCKTSEVLDQLSICAMKTEEDNKTNSFNEDRGIDDYLLEHIKSDILDVKGQAPDEQNSAVNVNIDDNDNSINNINNITISVIDDGENSKKDSRKSNCNVGVNTEDVAVKGKHRMDGENDMLSIDKHLGAGTTEQLYHYLKNYHSQNNTSIVKSVIGSDNQMKDIQQTENMFNWNRNCNLEEPVVRESKMRHMLASAELLLNKTRELACSSQVSLEDSRISASPTQSTQSLLSNNYSNVTLRFEIPNHETHVDNSNANTFDDDCKCNARVTESKYNKHKNNVNKSRLCKRNKKCRKASQ